MWHNQNFESNWVNELNWVVHKFKLNQILGALNSNQIMSWMTSYQMNWVEFNLSRL